MPSYATLCRVLGPTCTELSVMRQRECGTLECVTKESIFAGQTLCEVVPAMYNPADAHAVRRVGQALTTLAPVPDPLTSTLVRGYADRAPLANNRLEHVKNQKRHLTYSIGVHT